MNRLLLVFVACSFTLVIFAQTDSNYVAPHFDQYKIYLAKPAKEIQQLLYEKDCTPINGRISEEKKSIIMENYEPGSKVHIKIFYLDGTDDEFVRSPCFIDPVIL